MSFLTGLTRGIQNGMQLAEKQRQEGGIKSLIDLLGQQENYAKRIKTANTLYDTDQSWQAANPAIKASGYKFDNSLTGDDKVQKTGFGLPDLVPQKPSYKDNLSLVPASCQEEPEYDTASMYGLLKKAVAAGVPAPIALSVIPGYYSGKQAEAEKAANLAEQNSVLSRIDENTSPIDLIKVDARLRAKGHPGLNGYALTDLVKFKQAKGFSGQNGPEQPKYYGSSTNVKPQAEFVPPLTAQPATQPAESGDAWYSRTWANARNQYKQVYPNLSDEELDAKAYGYMTYLIKANEG